jgi:hypothetical protein
MTAERFVLRTRQGFAVMDRRYRDYLHVAKSTRVQPLRDDGN